VEGEYECRVRTNELLFARWAFSHISIDLATSSMTRGNQRETDRARAQAREAGKGKKSEKGGLTPQQRNER
jgi:hypothetical protein